MAKMSDWKIVATEGATVDGRAISPNWINEMADSYSPDEYTALIWPEHNRSNWSKYEGDNWGIVEKLKAEKRGGLLRLLAKITPNDHLLTANANQQKLFTSIEPNPDYKGKGSCYLMGLAVTDSPASSGTTRLTFSTSNGKETSLEYSQLEEIEFSECDQTSLISNAINTLAKFFQTGGQLPGAETNPQEEEPMNEKQFNEIKGTLASISEKQEAQQTTLDEFSEKFAKQAAEENPEGNAPEGEAPESKKFSEVTTQLQTITESITSLQNQFKDLTKEVPGQENDGEGANTVTEAY